MSDEGNKIIRSIVFSIIFLASIFFLAEIFIFANAQDIWQDEVTQLYGVSLGPKHFLAWLVGQEKAHLNILNDRMPPGSYMIDWFWSRIVGPELLPFRLFHALHLLLLRGCLIDDTRLDRDQYLCRTGRNSFFHIFTETDCNECRDTCLPYFFSIHLGSDFPADSIIT